MRRSTAAAVGTLTGAALIVGVRLSVTPPAAPAAVPPVVDLAGGTPTRSSSSPLPSSSLEGNRPPRSQASASARSAAPTQARSTAPSASPSPSSDSGLRATDSGLRDGVYRGKAVTNPYGTVRVQIRVEGGRITAAEATYPTTGDSARINPPAIATLKQETLKAQSADVAAVSGATYTSRSYRDSLQAALDAAAA